MNSETESSPRQERLEKILLEYVEAMEHGSAPDAQTLQTNHPEFAQEIGEFLAGYQKLNRLTVPLRSERDALALTRELGELGDYRLLREIGRGGMGIVYEAEQISLRRRVALKVLPFAAGVDARQLQRFRNEAEAAAHLHHSHIVPVFAVGSERGVHYYAMQYIEGQSLATLIAALHTSPERQRRDSSDPVAGAPGSCENTQASLSTEHSARSRRFFQTVAVIGKQTAEALEYAHQMGIVHRDIKPANLLLDARGQVWITDFGLAQFQSNVGLTMTGELLGTLRYVSPEQAMARRGVVDHRADIYSLGASLYELLTLQPVFDGRDRHALLHQIGFEEPRPPRAIDATIPVELETIVLKALAKNPAERYATAQEFADDLQRFLEDKPIRAKRPSLLDRTRKWMRRHPSVVVTAVLLLVLGLVGFAVSTAMVAREQGRTQAAYEREKQRAEEAEQRFRLARRSADEMIQVAEEELADNPGMQNLRRRLLEAALVYYQEFIEQRQGDPDAQAELAVTRDRVKKILQDLAVLQGGAQFFLLRDQAVLRDLDLTDEQRGQLSELSQGRDKERDELFRGFGKLPHDERQKRFLDMARASDSALASILRPAQRRRLRQIMLQCQNVLAFREPDVVQALKLTAAQKRQIRALEFTMFFGDGEKDRPQPPWKMHEERRKTVMQQALKLLTAEQAKQWRELTGTPFASAGRMFMPPGLPPGGFGPPPKFGPPAWPKER